jgi:hypothetical protein
LLKIEAAAPEVAPAVEEKATPAKKITPKAVTKPAAKPVVTKTVAKPAVKK